tara:strand:- start:5209 stop:5325 length:117 start_codon:yes stop_codon:yes gene_type:complete
MAYGNGGGKKSKSKCRKVDGKMVCNPKPPKKSKKGIYK